MASAEANNLAAEQTDKLSWDKAGFAPKERTFSTKHEERTFLKESLAAGYRLFAKYGFDEGVGSAPHP